MNKDSVWSRIPKVSFPSDFLLLCVKVEDTELNTVRVRVTILG